METTLVRTENELRDADILLFRSATLVGREISATGRSIYSHAGMAAWWRGRVFLLETVQWHGGRAVLLANAIRGCTVDVYRDREMGMRDAELVVEEMLKETGRRYGWWNLLRASLAHTPVLRLLCPAKTDDALDGSLPFCSQAVARAYREGWRDLVPCLADRYTEPGDLARSALLQYQFTLVS